MFTAKASTVIRASREKVWRALTDPQAIKQYMFGADVTSDWKAGSAITWRGEWQGKPFEDKGEVLEARPNEHLAYRHQNHRVSIELSPEGDATRLTLTQDGNPDEKARDHAQKNWEMMLGGLRKVAE
jgi:uncharacterized protein YndB with AHSA1/START domain